MTTDLIPDAKVVELMREIVAEKGANYVYPFTRDEYGEAETCAYFAGGVPMCIVGHLMHKLDVPIHGVLELESVAVQPLPVSGAVAHALAVAQAAQDFGESWGVALAMFEDELAEVCL